jgi:hypothetical protein
MQILYVGALLFKHYIESQSDRQDGAVGTDEWSIPTIRILGMVEWAKT